MSEDATDQIVEELRAALMQVRRAEAAALVMRGAGSAGSEDSAGSAGNAGSAGSAGSAGNADNAGGVQRIYAEMEKLHWAAGDALELIRPDGM